MAEPRNRNLQLVTHSGDTPKRVAAERQFEVVALGELDASEQDWVRAIVGHTCPQAAIIGVALTPRSWDIRPIVIRNSENDSTIIRLLGPEVTLSRDMTNRMHDLLQRVSTSPELSSCTLEWGVFDGQMWFRRELVDKTFANTLNEKSPMQMAEAVAFAKRLVQEVKKWHARGICHGHITPQNIAIKKDGTLSLLDAGVGLSLVHANHSFGREEFPRGYNQESFAPEVINGDAVILATDVYSVGIVLSRLFSTIEQQLGLGRESPSSHQHGGHESIIQRLHDAFRAMGDTEPRRRPVLSDIALLLDDALPTIQGAKVEKRKPNVEHRSEHLHPRAFFEEPKLETKTVSPAITREEQRPAAAEQDIRQSSAPPAASITVTLREDAESFFEDYEDERPVAAEPLPVRPAPQNLDHSNLNESPKRSTPGRVRPLAHREPAPEYFPDPRTQRHVVERRRSVASWGMIVGCIVLASFLLLRAFGGEGSRYYSQEELELAWQSNVPSAMLVVAEAALAVEPPDKFAQMLVTRSAMSGENVNGLVDIALLRIAFDKRWEAELTESDRRVALALSLSRLVNRVPADLPSFEGVHHGVLLAITATGGERVSSILKQVPVSTLTRLPEPYGGAFQMLAQSDPHLTCGDSVVWQLARIGTGGLEERHTVVEFLSTDTEFRLKVLAQMFSGNEVDSGRLLDIVLNHSVLKEATQSLKWGKQFELSAAEDIRRGDQLLLIAGLPAEGALGERTLLNTIAHPVSQIRSSALEQVGKRISFLHPAATDLIATLVKKPELLTERQTAVLITILMAPSRVPAERIRSWIDSKPPAALLQLLLLATADETQSTPLDFEIMRALRRTDWQPTKEMLQKLSHHPDKLVRLFAYSKIYEFSDRQESLQLLSAAYSKESDPAHRSRLEELIANLKSFRD